MKPDDEKAWSVMQKIGTSCLEDLCTPPGCACADAVSEAITQARKEGTEAAVGAIEAYYEANELKLSPELINTVRGIRIIDVFAYPPKAEE